uniref:Uncharacterized protein n=1 Tax=Panagrolaimus davidi TaxID=227884 RepID=A0A914RBB3_9BILA
MENIPPDINAPVVSYSVGSSSFAQSLSNNISTLQQNKTADLKSSDDAKNVSNKSDEDVEGEPMGNVPSKNTGPTPSKKRKITSKQQKKIQLAAAGERRVAMEEYGKKKRPVKERYDEFVNLKNRQKELEEELLKMKIKYENPPKKTDLTSLHQQRTEVEELKQEHNQKINDITQQFKAEFDSLKQKYEKIENELVTAKENHDLTMKYCEDVRKRLADSERQNEKLKSEIKKQTKPVESNVPKRTAKDILENGWTKDEWKLYFGTDNPILRLSANIKKASAPIQKERIKMCILEMAWLAAPRTNFRDEETQLNLQYLLEKVNDLLKEFDAECETVVDKVNIDGDNNASDFGESEGVEVTTVTNLKTVITKRFQRFADFKKLKSNPAPFQDELWISILGDKGGKSMKLALALGNQDNPNSSEKLLLCGMYDGDSNAKTIYAAFLKMATQIKDILEVVLTIDGAPKTFKVRWFLAGDYEFLLQVCGRKSASATYYCFRCLFAKPTPNNFKNDCACAKGTLRENFEKVETDTGYLQEPLFTNIPPNQIIMPCLHIFMGIVTMLLKLLEDNLKKVDFAKLSPNEREEAQNNLKEIDSEIEKMQEKLEDNESQILENVSELEVLRDIIAKNEKHLPSNKKQRNQCQMDFCVKRAGYYVEDKFWSCTCCPRPKKYHEFCIGSNISNKKLSCKVLEKYQKNGGLLSSIPAQIEKLQKDSEKRETVVENMKIKIEAAVIKKYDFEGDNMKEYTQILKELKVSKQAWYQTLCGNHVHKLLLNAEKFENLSCLKESKDVENIVNVFKLLKNIQMYSQSRFLNPEEVADLKKQTEALKLCMFDHRALQGASVVSLLI